MPCPVCTNRLLRIFTRDTAIAPLFSAAISVSRRLLWHYRIPEPSALNKYTTSARTSSTRQRKHQQSRLFTQRYRSIGLAYSRGHFSDDDYMPFITEAPPPPPPPLRWSSEMSRIPPRATEAVDNGMLEMPEHLELKGKKEFRARQRLGTMKASKSIKNIKGMSERATFMQTIEELNDESSLSEGQEDKRVQGLSKVKIKHNNEEGTPESTVPAADYSPAIFNSLQSDRLDTHGNAEGDPEKLVRQIAQKMEQVELEVATLPANMPVRGTLTPATTSGAKRLEKSHSELVPKPARTRAQYNNIWNLTPFLQPNNTCNLPRPCDKPFIMKSVEGPNYTINSILQSTNKHSYWLVQKAALAKKFNNNPWRTYTKVSPGTVQLIKEINAVVPYTLKAYDIARKFKISMEAARRILRCKWMPTDAEKEKRARSWFERGEKIRAMQMERGDILTKEQRQEAWKKKERKRLIKEMNLKFGLLSTDTRGKDEVQRSLGKIKWEGKIL